MDTTSSASAFWAVTLNTTSSTATAGDDGRWMKVSPQDVFRSSEGSPVQLASLASMTIDGCFSIYEGV